MENTSGSGSTATVPGEIDKWNWGAFLLHWIWGVGNSTYIALLMFVPFVNIVMMFILGAKGSAWAWRNKKWDSVEHFKKVQRQWMTWAVIIYAFFIIVGAGLVSSIQQEVRNSEIYQLSVQRIAIDKEVLASIGTPIETGFPWGLMETTEPFNLADFFFDVQGPIGEGTIYVLANNELGQWKIIRMVLEREGSDGLEEIELVGEDESDKHFEES